MKRTLLVAASFFIIKYIIYCFFRGDKHLRIATVSLLLLTVFLTAVSSNISVTDTRHRLTTDWSHL